MGSNGVVRSNRFSTVAALRKTRIPGGRSMRERSSSWSSVRPSTAKRMLMSGESLGSVLVLAELPAAGGIGSTKVQRFVEQADGFRIVEQVLHRKVGDPSDTPAVVRGGDDGAVSVDREERYIGPCRRIDRDLRHDVVGSCRIGELIDRRKRGEARGRSPRRSARRATSTGRRSAGWSWMTSAPTPCIQRETDRGAEYRSTPERPESAQLSAPNASTAVEPRNSATWRW